MCAGVDAALTVLCTYVNAHGRVPSAEPLITGFHVAAFLGLFALYIAAVGVAPFRLASSACKAPVLKAVNQTVQVQYLSLLSWSL
jgi:hypothetical protein